MNRLSRRPLAGIALFFMAGICLGLTCPVPPIFPLASGIILLLICLACGGLHSPRTGRLASAAILLAIACTGWTHAALRMESLPTPVAAILRSPATGMGVISVLNEDATAVSAGTNTLLWKAPVTLEQIRLSRDTPWQTVGGPAWVRFQLPSGFKPPRYGERWVFSGYLSPGTNSTARGKSIAPVFVSAGRSAHRIARDQGNALVQFALNARAKTLSILNHGITGFSRETAILNSLLLGIRGQMPRELYQSFANTSTLHVFAISGSHVVILAGVLVLALAAAGIPRTRWILALTPVLLLYTIMTGLQSSATRACIMGILFWAAPLLGRKPDLHSSLGAAAIILLAWDPENLTDAGFLLSFVAVLGLALFTPVFFSPWQRYWQKDPLQVQPEPWWKNAGRDVVLAFGGLVAMTLAATLVSAPLTAFYFGSVAPIGLLGNLLAVPVASLMILTGALSLTLGSCALVFADIFNHANVALAFILDRFIAFLAAVPGGHWTITPPSPWSLLLLYAAMINARFALWILSTPPVKPAPEAPPEIAT